VEHYPSINVEGRRFSANCTVGPGLGPQAQQQDAARELPVEIQIFETARMQSQLAKLPQGALGSFTFRDATPPAIDAFLSGWFVLHAQSFEDAWNQVRQGGYSECTIMLNIGPIESAVGWLWDVGQSPHLVIDTIAISFTRPPPTLGETTEKKRSSFWRRR
jgi:hypothetical protein